MEQPDPQNKATATSRSSSFSSFWAWSAVRNFLRTKTRTRSLLGLKSSVRPDKSREETLVVQIRRRLKELWLELHEHEHKEYDQRALDAKQDLFAVCYSICSAGSRLSYYSSHRKEFSGTHL